MNILYWLDQIQASERLLVGEKVFYLSQLRQQDYPVLPGFAIGAAAFWEFLEQLDDSQSLLADFPHSSIHLDVENSQALQLVAQQSRQAIINAPFPSDLLSILVAAAQQLQSSVLILRSSLSLPVPLRHDFSGLLPSQVCWCEPDALALAIKQAWSNLFSAKSLFYWQRRGLEIEQVNLSILVQPMQNAIASGTLNIQTHSIDIQATSGLSDSLFKGEVIPDAYEIEQPTGIIKTQHLGNKTRAYRLKSRLNLQDLNRNCLETYLLNSEQQEQYALDETSLKQLIQLSQHLAFQKQYQGSLEWILTQASEDEPPHFYLTQSRPEPSKIAAPELSKDDSGQLLYGLSASAGIAIAPIQVITHSESHLPPILEGRILVARNIQPDWLPWLKQVRGVITEQGGLTSHAAIMARELRIPAVVGVTNATQLLKTEATVLLNGDRGEIYNLQANKEVFISQPSSTDGVTPPLPFNPINTQLMVNLSQLSSIASTTALPVNGVGLLRSELMLSELLATKPLSEWLEASQKQHFVEQLTQLISEFAKGFAPRPVFYRSLDWLASSLNSASSLEQRGTAQYLSDPTYFDIELQALAQVYASGYTNVNLILPFVRSVEEFSFCRHRVEQIGLTRHESFQLWMMAEVPSVLFLLTDYVQAGVQGIAIGTNDLTQLLLGVEREQTLLSERLNARHPAMLAALKQLIKLARKAGIPCSICGQASVQYPELIDSLVRWGITAISVEPDAVERTYQAIARAERHLLLEAAREIG